MRRELTFALTLAALACGNEGSSADGQSGSGAGGLAGSSTGGQAGLSGGAASGGGGAAGGGGTSGSGGAGADEPVVFAVIGDFGDAFLSDLGIGGLERVATLVNGWEPDFIATTGDNNYPDGAAATMDPNVGQFFHQYIGNYQGTFGEGSETNRFWPTLGNHDWNTPNVQPHLDYFTLPGNERYYDVDMGRLHLFMVDSESEEPDGATQDSVQGQWLRDRLQTSTACFKLVFFHRPGYSSGRHGSTERMQWPFEEWSADAVLAGHDHLYERLEVGGIPHFVNGMGGSLLYAEGTRLPESEVFFRTAFGAQRVTLEANAITFEAITVDGELVDIRTIEKDCG